MSLKNYERPSLTTDMVLFRVKDNENNNSRKYAKKELQVLLIERDAEPSMGLWSLPGGFVDIDEEIFDNVKRKLKLKTGVEGDFYVEQLYTWGAIDRDARGRVISVSFMGLCNEETYIQNEVDRNIGWFNVFDVLDGGVGELAFDHKKIIEYALERLRGKIDYTDIAFNLLPTEFTMRECQNVYELILNRQIDNFRRKVNEYVENTGEYKQGTQFRTAELYKVRKSRSSKF